MSRIATVLAVLAVVSQACASAFARQASTPTVCHDQQDGGQLNDQTAAALKRSVIQAYDELRRTGGFGSPFDGTDITKAIKPYICPGMSFDDAETLLKAAGFVVVQGPGEYAENDPNKPRAC